MSPAAIAYLSALLLAAAVVLPGVWHVMRCPGCRRPRRTIEAGGRQGRGNPYVRTKRSGNEQHAAVLLAAHVWNETPGLQLREGHKLTPTVHFVAAGILRRCWRHTGPAA